MAAAVAPVLSAGAPVLDAAPSPRSGAAVPAPCLIVNEASFRASRGGLAVRAAALGRAHGADVMAVGDAATIDAAVDQILARRQRHLMVLAGDGTVQGIVDRLARLPPEAWVPDLFVLPGGRSNLTAADLAPRGDVLASLERALRLAREQRWDAALVERTTLRVEQAPAPPRHGFFIGAALVNGVIRRVHAYRAAGRGPLRRGHVSSAWSVLRLGALAVLRRSGLGAVPLVIDAGDGMRLEAPVRLLLATTLLHRTGLFDPYAARGAGDLRVTAVALRAPRFWRSLPRLLTGRYSASMNLANGYLSGRCERLRISGIDGYALDGETFAADPARPVEISLGRTLRFLVP